jgi:DNA-directed RNA polymerase subunit delta
MRRVIVDYKKLNKEILDLLVQKFPYGYDSEDIIAFKNAQNETIEAVEVRTEDTIYLVKVSKRLLDTMELFQDDSDYDDSDENETETPEVADESSDESEDY